MKELFLLLFNYLCVLFFVLGLYLFIVKPEKIRETINFWVFLTTMVFSLLILKIVNHHQVIQIFYVADVLIILSYIFFIRNKRPNADPNLEYLLHNVKHLRTLNEKAYNKLVVLLLKSYGFQSIKHIDVKDESLKGGGDNYILAQREGQYFEIRMLPFLTMLTEKDINVIADAFRDSTTQSNVRILFTCAVQSEDTETYIANSGISFKLFDAEKTKELIMVLAPNNTDDNGIKTVIRNVLDYIVIFLSRIRDSYSPVTKPTDLENTIEQTSELFNNLEADMPDIDTTENEPTDIVEPSSQVDVDTTVPVPEQTVSENTGDETNTDQPDSASSTDPIDIEQEKPSTDNPDTTPDPKNHNENEDSDEHHTIDESLNDQVVDDDSDINLDGSQFLAGEIHSQTSYDDDDDSSDFGTATDDELLGGSTSPIEDTNSSLTTDTIELDSTEISDSDVNNESVESETESASLMPSIEELMAQEAEDRPTLDQNELHIDIADDIEDLQTTQQLSIEQLMLEDEEDREIPVDADIDVPEVGDTPSIQLDIQDLSNEEPEIEESTSNIDMDINEEHPHTDLFTEIGEQLVIEDSLFDDAVPTSVQNIIDQDNSNRNNKPSQSAPIQQKEKRPRQKSADKSSPDQSNRKQGNKGQPRKKQNHQTQTTGSNGKPDKYNDDIQQALQGMELDKDAFKNIM